MMVMSSASAFVLELGLGGVAASKLRLGGIEASHLVGCLLSTPRAAFLSLGVVAAWKSSKLKARGGIVLYFHELGEKFKAEKEAKTQSSCRAGPGGRAWFSDAANLDKTLDRRGLQ